MTVVTLIHRNDRGGAAHRVGCGGLALTILAVTSAAERGCPRAHRIVKTSGSNYEQGKVALGGHGIALCVGSAKAVSGPADGGVAIIVATAQLSGLAVLVSTSWPEQATVIAPIVTKTPAPVTADSAFTVPRTRRKFFSCIIFSFDSGWSTEASRWPSWRRRISVSSRSWAVISPHRRSGARPRARPASAIL
jgi:hypothetical protein